MRAYLARRGLLFIPTCLGVTIIIFAIMRIIPGDVATLILGAGGGAFSQQEHDALAGQLGLNRPLHEQYFSWLWGFLRLDAGDSLWSGEPIFKEIARRLPTTAELAIMTIVASLIIAVPIGTISAMRQDTWIDYLFRIVTIGGIAVPPFWVGTLTILLLVRVFHWVPPLEYVGFFKNPSENLQQLIWPAIALGYYYSALVGRMTRSCMLEVLRQDYIRTAWAKGLQERMVIIRHALKNAILPVVTISGIQLAYLMGGTVIMESIFIVPGMGKNLVDSILHRDYPMVQTVITIFALVVLTANLLVDLLYAWLDPRISYK